MKRISVIHLILVVGTLILCSSMLGVPLIYEDEFIEVIKERVVFETTNPFAQNEIFSIDGKQYYLLRVPYTGVSWK